MEARYYGDYMIMVNKENLTPQSWSLRDITKILMRIKNQKLYNENFKDIGTAINLLYYSLSSTTQEQLNGEIVDQLIKLLKSIFREKVDEEDLKKVYYDEPKLVSEYNYKNQKRVYYIQKNNSQIYFDTIDLEKKRNEEANKKKIETYEKYAKLPNFLECLFRMKLSNYDEPLLLSGHTCYKTYASKLLLEKADVVS